jgi:hypothetical protein
MSGKIKEGDVLRIEVFEEFMLLRVYRKGKKVEFKEQKDRFFAHVIPSPSRTTRGAAFDVAYIILGVLGMKPKKKRESTFVETTGGKCSVYYFEAIKIE